VTSVASPHTERPRSDAIRPPSRFMIEPLRPVARFVVRRWIGVRVHGAEHVPATGPVIFAANHVGVMDGPLLAIFAPRPVHVLTKVEMFKGWLGRLLRGAGQIPLDRFRSDPAAVKTCLRVLRDGRAVGIFPEGRRGGGDLTRIHRGAAYLALVSGAPIVPVVFLGTRQPGGHNNSLPPRGKPVDVVFGAPHQLSAVPWPRTREQVEQSSVLIRDYLQAHLDRALTTTGRELPGPVPAAEVERDPATGVTEQGAP
jgi:1-acyl-sn-glycerol-3-phosphate acyltransferase